jgi:glyoxylase-like metal-dependent hydrolase (beta-lactamase superfamily II)
MGDMLQEIAPGVYGIVGGPVNAYVLDDPIAGVTIIDAGLPGWAKRIMSLVLSIGRKADEVGRILITHADIDHVGGLGPLAAATGAEICASGEAALYLRERKSPPHIGFPMIVPVALMNFIFRRGVSVARILEDGDRLDVLGGLRVVVTKGHTPDHLCYFLEREGLLFAGDLMRNVEGLEIFPRNAWSRDEAARSICRVAGLRPSSICPGHGRVWRESEDSGALDALARDER